MLLGHAFALGVLQVFLGHAFSLAALRVLVFGSFFGHASGIFGAGLRASVLPGLIGASALPGVM